MKYEPASLTDARYSIIRTVRRLPYSVQLKNGLTTTEDTSFQTYYTITTLISSNKKGAYITYKYWANKRVSNVRKWDVQL